LTTGANGSAVTNEGPQVVIVARDSDRIGSYGQLLYFLVGFRNRFVAMVD
jgi:hypothetical protein